MLSVLSCIRYTLYSAKLCSGAKHPDKEREESGCGGRRRFPGRKREYLYLYLYLHLCLYLCVIFVFVFVLRQRREDVEEEGVFLRERESESSIIDGAFENVNLG